MILVDVNVLIAAFFEDHQHHRAASRWLGEALEDPLRGVLVPDIVWVGFVRIATNRRVFAIPASPPEAMAYVRAVTGAPGYVHVAGLGGDIEAFLVECLNSGAIANLVTDAYIAAVARRNGCAVATFDRGFRRFDGVEVVVPSLPAC